MTRLRRGVLAFMRDRRHLPGRGAGRVRPRATPRRGLPVHRGLEKRAHLRQARKMPSSFSCTTPRAGPSTTSARRRRCKSRSSSAAETSGPLDLEPSFDPDTGLGTHGEFDAAIIPTQPGNYTFHFYGSINGQPIEPAVHVRPGHLQYGRGSDADRVPDQGPDRSRSCRPRQPSRAAGGSGGWRRLVDRRRSGQDRPHPRPGRCHPRRRRSGSRRRRPGRRPPRHPGRPGATGRPLGRPHPDHAASDRRAGRAGGSWRRPSAWAWPGPPRPPPTPWPNRPPRRPGPPWPRRPRR